jgi:uncharacterized membrane protein
MPAKTSKTHHSADVGVHRVVDRHCHGSKELGVVLPFFRDFAAVTGGMRCTKPFILAGAIVTVFIAFLWLAHQHRLSIAMPLSCGG